MFGIDGLYVDVVLEPDGGVTIHGQQLTAASDYEYWISIAAAAVPRFAEALGTSTGGVQAAWSASAPDIVRTGETSWLDAHRIPFTLSTWTSFND